MDDALENVFETIFIMVIALFLLTFCVTTFIAQDNYTKLLVEKNKHNITSEYSLAYFDGDKLLTKQNVFLNMISADDNVDFYIDDIIINSELIKGARNNETLCIKKLLSYISDCDYSEVLFYDGEGNIVKIHYVQET